MNKTIIINISGVIFHIEEDAYEFLRSYMNDIKGHFGGYKDHLEIVTDIENRIAEMLSELLLNESKQVIVIADVANVTQRMGKPADFDMPEEEDYDLGNDKSATVLKKLYRDTEDKVIGGVCSGIGHYFGIQPKWTRIGFLLMLFFFGFSVLAYLLLWMIIPKAKTRTDKMEMKGEKINLQAFQKNIEKELKGIGSTLKKSSGISAFFYKIGAFIQNFIEGFVNFLGNTGKMIFKFLGLCLMIFIGFLLIAAFVFLMVFLGYAGNTDIATIFPLNIINQEIRPVLFICAFLIIVVPLIALLFLILRIIFKSKTIPNSLNLSLAIVWIGAIAIGAFFIAKIATEFKEEASYTETTTLNTTSSDSYILRLGDERTLREEQSGKGLNTKLIRISGSDRDFDTPNEFDLELKVSDGDTPILSKTYIARGSNFNDAINNAHQIDYYYQQKDSVLTFDHRFDLRGLSLWRSQQVKIKLQIPVNSTLLIEKRMADRLFWHQLNKCIDREANPETLIRVKATKNGFVCNKTPEVIEKEKEYNAERNIDEEVSDTVLF
ncbi:MAG TPA: PspC domain-containing protein [Pelobium sp.]|nr:PspC domain-containing protein [Pelobium sp.]